VSNWALGQTQVFYKGTTLWDKGVLLNYQKAASEQD
jgi:hypothetical protein